MGINWEALIVERNQWVEHNFPTPHIVNPGESILGVIEEVGELSHSYLKAAQNIRGNREQHQEDAKDAIADITIYLLGVMNIGGLPVAPPFTQGTRSVVEALMFLSLAAGECSRAYQEAEGHYNGLPEGETGNYQEPMGRVIWCCEEICKWSNWDYEELVIQTWLKVKQRDWALYPDTGLPPEQKTVNL